MNSTLPPVRKGAEINGETLVDVKYFQIKIGAARF